MKNNKKLTLSKRGKKLFKIYAMSIFTFAITIGTSMTVLAADDPLTVVNNLSEQLVRLYFWTYSCDRYDIARLWCSTNWFIIKKPRSITTCEWFSNFGRWSNNYLC